jgi:hypothetical protein
MPDPESFLQAVGRQLQTAVIEAQEALEETLPPDPDYQARVGQLNQIRATAEQQAMAQLLPSPEDEQE